MDWPRLAVDVERCLSCCAGCDRRGSQGSFGDYFVNMDICVQNGVLKRVDSKP
jgi:hypothetical protein